HAVRQQIANGDRTHRRYSIIEIRGNGFEHTTMCQLWQPGFNRIVEPYLAFLDQNHGCNGCNELGDRSNAKDRVALHRGRITERQGPQRFYMDIVMMTDERHESRYLLTLEISRQHLMHALQS